MPTLDLQSKPETLHAFSKLNAKCAATVLVLPKTLKPATLALVGESLGADEVAQNDYFVGKAGKLLSKLLSDAGLIRDTIHITNVVKVQPPANKMDRLGELGLSVNDFLPYLKEELTLVNPKAILAVGAHAMHALTGMSEITKWRGSVLNCTLLDNPIPVIPTLHPSYLQRGQMHLYPYVRHDIKTFAQVGFSIYQPPDPYEQTIEPTITQAVDFLSELLSTGTETCFDIETVAKQRITCIGWTNGPNRAICIPFRANVHTNYWSEGEQLMLLDLMRQIFAKPGLVKIGQSMHYDMHFLLPLLGFPREPLFDTRFAHFLIHPDAKHDLGFLTSVYTNMNYHKDEFKDWSQKQFPKDHTLWEYNIKDVIATHRVYRRLKADLQEEGLYDFFTGYVMPFRRVLFEMEHRGLRVDTKLMTEWREFIEQQELPVAQAVLNKMVGFELNPNSSKQVGTYLHQTLKMPVPQTALGNYTVREEVLEALIARYPKHRHILEQILCVRVLKAKELGTYLTAPLSPDGRLKCSFGSTVTGRLSSSSNHLGQGTNLQNIPPHLRQVVIPEPGQVFVEPDLSQAEVRVMAWLMNSPKLKQIFHSGEKIHKIVGGWIYDKHPNKLTPDEYLIAKRTVHGSNYDMGERKFATTIGKPVAEARLIREHYFQIVPELRAYHQYIRDTVERERKLVTPYGRSRIFTGRLDDETFRSAYAQIPQSTVVDTINIGTLALWLIKPPDIHICTQTHDSILISLPEDKVEWFRPYVKTHLETLRRVWINGDWLTIPVDIKKPKLNWYGH
uniref:Putative DNA polymerase n=1 Tax=viral metagenome TaxID=1070528 RepID=A0A6M3IID5_9ZZZZ